MKRIRVVGLFLQRRDDYWSAEAINEAGNVAYATARPTAGRALRALLNGASLRLAYFEKAYEDADTIHYLKRGMK